MLTHCPACGTTFRISSEQLKVRQGRVRCGQCHGEFNAIESLIDESAPPPQPPPLPTVTEETADPGGIWVSSREAEVPKPADPVIEPPLPEPADPVIEPPLPEPAAPVIEPPLPEPLEHPPVTEVVATPSPAAAVSPLPSPAPEAPADEPEPLLEDEEFAPRRWPWVVGSIVAALLLATQAAMHFRVELAAKAPSTRPILIAACNLIGCQVPLPMEITAIGIDTSDLHPDNDHPGHLQLLATLRNRAGYAQIWPHLEVSLTDATDRILVRKAIPPADYLPAKQKPESGFPAKGDQLVQLDLQAPDVPAVGYRLYVFYP